MTGVGQGRQEIRKQTVLVAVVELEGTHPVDNMSPSCRLTFSSPSSICFEKAPGGVLEGNPKGDESDTRLTWGSVPESLMGLGI